MGKYKALILGILVILAGAYFYTHPDKVKVAQLIFKADFIKNEFTAQELKEYVDYGLLPYEVYRYAQYIQLKDPDARFRLTRLWDDSIIYTIEVLDNDKDAPVLGPVEGGSYVEKLNNTTYRVVTFFYDDIRGITDYLVFKVDVPKTADPRWYFRDTIFPPSYVKEVHYNVTMGNVTVECLHVNSSKPLTLHDLYVWYDQNPIDAGIAREIARQLKEYAEGHGLTRKGLIELAEKYVGATIHYDLEMASTPLNYVKVEAFDGENLVVENVTNDGYLKGILLSTRGVCADYAFVLSYILEALGVKALWIVDLKRYHALNAYELDVRNPNDLKYYVEHYNNSILRLCINGNCSYWVLVDTTDSEYDLGTITGIPTTLLGDDLNIIIYYNPTFETNKELKELLDENLEVQ